MSGDDDGSGTSRTFGPRVECGVRQRPPTAPMRITPAFCNGCTNWCPDLKLAYLVRDPIERVVYHFMQRREDADATPFRRSIAACEQPDNLSCARADTGRRSGSTCRTKTRRRSSSRPSTTSRAHRRETMREGSEFVCVDPTSCPANSRYARRPRDQARPQPHRGAMAEVAPAAGQPPVLRHIRDRTREPANRMLTGLGHHARSSHPRSASGLSLREHLVDHLRPEVDGPRRAYPQRVLSWSL